VRVQALDAPAFLCDECEAFWLEEAKLGTDDFVQYTTFMEQHGFVGLWSELQANEERWYHGQSNALPVTAFVLSSPQAFAAMLHYLDIWRTMGEEGAISALLKQMGEVGTGKPASKAIWAQWLRAVGTVVGVQATDDVLLNARQALDVTIEYLDGCYQAAPTDDLGALLGGLGSVWGQDTTGDPAAWSDWLEAIRRVLL
jgi:hypothetical protein